MTGVEDPGGDGLFGLGTPPDQAGVVVVPVPFEATVSYGRGTAGGPSAILAASDQLDLFDLETGRPYEAGIAMLAEDSQVRAWNHAACAAARPVIEAGGATTPELAAAAREVDAYGEQVNDWLRATVEPLLARGALVGVVGGDHSTPFGSIAAHAERYPGLGILHVDAHADLRDAYEGFTWSHASILFNVQARLPQVAAVTGVGYRDLAESEMRILEEDPRFHAFPDPLLRRRLQEGSCWSELCAQVVATLPQQVYVSFDIDGLDPGLCPHTGTPVPGGLSFPEACGLLRELVESGREVVGFDLVEVSPDPSGLTEWDANVGARVLYKLIGFALKSRANSAA